MKEELAFEGYNYDTCLARILKFLDQQHTGTMRGDKRIEALALLLVGLFSSAAATVEVRRSQFPSDFLFGTATASYQIEGGFKDGDKGPSNWDTFSHKPGKIEDESNGDVADDHYHLYTRDIDLMSSLGVNAYRLSISWSRILPGGRGDINPHGIQFYEKLLNYLLQKGITPFVTLSHYDVPQALEDEYGAWLSDRIQEDFAYFATVCFKAFGTKVKYWSTFNEPNVMVNKGYRLGTFPPSRCSSPYGNCSAGDSYNEPFIAAHNVILSHARAAQIYKNIFQKSQKGSIGIVMSTTWFEPYEDNPIERLAAERAKAFEIGWFLDPLIYGSYPPEMIQLLGSNLPKISSEEKKKLSSSLDFIGVNHYTSIYSKDCLFSKCNENGELFLSNGSLLILSDRNGVPIGERTGMSNLFVTPFGMEKIVMYVKDRYKNMPMYITENGYSQKSDEKQTAEDFVNDKARVNFLKSYLSSLSMAIKNKANVKGYFVWSLLDNFEWLHGYTQRFGLYHVDFKTLKRTPKLSAKWYTDFLKNYKKN